MMPRALDPVVVPHEATASGFDEFAATESAYSNSTAREIIIQGKPRIVALPSS
jgi:hypothetical protein